MIEVEIDKENILKLLENLREEDSEELNEFFKTNSKKIFFEYCLNNKNTYFLSDKNKMPLAIGGVYEVFNENYKIGQVWLICGRNFNENKKDLYKYVKNKILIFKKEYDILYNYIYKSNFNSLFWLERNGFSSVQLKNENYKLFYFINGGIKFDIRYFTCE